MLDIKRTSKGKLPAYAYPGGYPHIYLDGNDNVLCASCATEALDDPDEYESWKPQTVGLYLEGEPLECTVCGTMIESAYE